MKRLLLSLALLCATTLVPAQVTIGSGDKPAAGALLDLKQDGTTEKGLGMPRVELKNLTPTNSIELAASIGATGNWNMTEHTGLVVYNTKAGVFNPATCKTTGAPIGLHVWEGTRWQGIGVKGIADPLELETATTLTDREGNTYAIASFGAAGTWMTENLRTTKAPGLTAMTESAEASYTDMYYAYPNGGNLYVGKPITWTAREGIFYNWYATMNRVTCNTTDQGQVAGTTPGLNEVENTDGFIQGICPTGWHVPSDREWNQLEKIISEDAASYAENYGGAGGSWTETYPAAAAWRGNHGMLLQSASQVGGGDTGYSKPASSGGLDLLLAGTAINGSALNYGIDAFLWSSSSGDSRFAWSRYVTKSHALVTRRYYDRDSLFSVRCKKN